MEQIKKKLLNKLELRQEGDIYYNIFNPEYTIEIEEDERLPSKLEFYSYAMENETTTYGNLSIKSYGTKLFSCQVVSLDSARYFTTVPEWEYISFDKYRKESKYCFKFFIKDTINYILHDFFYDESNSEEEYANSSFCDIVLFFENEDEKNSFIDKYDFVDYSYWDSGSPIMYALEYGNFRLLYANPYYKGSKKYGIEKNPIFTYPLMDHTLAFRNANKKMYIISNPYLTNKEISEIMEKKIGEIILGLVIILN